MQYGLSQALLVENVCFFKEKMAINNLHIISFQYI